MLINQKVKIKWTNKNKKLYELKGYIFTSYGDYFEVDISELTNGCESLVIIKCDYCGEEYSTRYDYYVNNSRKNIIGKDACNNCQFKKREETTLLKYGVKHVGQLESTKQKKIETCRSHYGVDHPGQSKEITEKMKQSRLENLGVEWAMQNKAVRKKTKESLYENGTGACSKQQKYLCNLLNGKLNYPVNNCSVDILLDNNFIIEYSGGGHDKNVHAGVITRKEFDAKERKRDYFIKSKGYKIIKIISPRDYLPPDEKIIELIEYAKQYMIENNRNHYNIEFGDKMQDVNYGKLRKITKKTLEDQEVKLDASFLLDKKAM